MKRATGIGEKFTNEFPRPEERFLGRTNNIGEFAPRVKSFTIDSIGNSLIFVFNYNKLRFSKLVVLAHAAYQCAFLFLPD